MFIVTTVVDTLRIPPALLAVPTIQAIHSEIDQKYPNRVLMDVGLVVGRYGDCLQVGHGVCVAGDGGAHHECKFRLIVFRPFVEEVCLGQIQKSTAEGIHVSLGFFDDIFIPAYWMLRPSHFEENTGLWVWTPHYDDGEDEGDEEDEANATVAVATNGSKHAVKTEENGGRMEIDLEDNDVAIEAENRFEMDIGSSIRFKVKSINFTQITNTAKGMQATTTTTAHVSSGSAGHSDEISSTSRPVRKRSSSVGLDDSQALPPSLYIVASICEDGLGLTNWWTTAEEIEPENATKLEEPKEEN
jgi:DNA-directed RNA polymerase III subunit RPC8